MLHVCRRRTLEKKREQESVFRAETDEGRLIVNETVESRERFIQTDI